MLIDGKQLSEMSEDEMRAFVERLQSEREALRNEAIKKAKERQDKGITVEVGDLPVTRKKREPSGKRQETDDFKKSILDFLKDDD